MQPLKPGCWCRLNTLRQHFCGLVFRNKNLGSHFCRRKYDTFPFLLPFLFASVRSHTQTMNTLVPSGVQPDTLPSGPGPPLASRPSRPPGSVSLTFFCSRFLPWTPLPLHSRCSPTLRLSWLFSVSPPPTPEPLPPGQHQSRTSPLVWIKLAPFSLTTTPRNRPAGALRAGTLARASL